MLHPAGLNFDAGGLRSRMRMPITGGGIPLFCMASAATLCKTLSALAKSIWLTAHTLPPNLVVSITLRRLAINSEHCCARRKLIMLGPCVAHLLQLPGSIKLTGNTQHGVQCSQVMLRNRPPTTQETQSAQSMGGINARLTMHVGVVCILPRQLHVQQTAWQV